MCVYSPILCCGLTGVNQPLLYRAFWGNAKIANFSSIFFFFFVKTRFLKYEMLCCAIRSPRCRAHATIERVIKGFYQQKFFFFFFFYPDQETYNIISVVSDGSLKWAMCRIVFPTPSPPAAPPQTPCARNRVLGVKGGWYSG